MQEWTSSILRVLSYPDFSPTIRERRDLTVFVFGHPRVSQDASSVTELLQELEELESVVEHLDGQFALIVDRGESASLVTDAFGSFPLFYARINGEYVVTPNYLLLWQELRDRDCLEIDEGAFLEFAHFQRLFGRRTYDRRSEFVPGASILTVACSERPEKYRYTCPRVGKPSHSSKQPGRKLAGALRGAVARCVASHNECSLLLSGGLDSRAILGAIPEDTTVTCYTLGEFRNNEVEVASALSEQVGADHEFVRRDPGYYEDCIERAVRVGGGMYAFNHAHFFGLKDALPETSGPVLHGHGLDYLFQGMYLPTDRRRIAGHPTYFERLRDVSGAIAESYRDGISYRLKDGTLERIVPRSDKDTLETELAESLDRVLQRAPEALDEYDRWDFLHVIDQARHYTHLNVMSIPSTPGQRTPAFDRELFDLFWTLPVSQRKEARVMKQAISCLDDRLTSVRNANTNLPACRSSFELTARAAWHALTRRVPLLPVIHEHPGAEGRSWPQRNALVRESRGIRSRATSLGSSRRLDSIGVFDLDAVGTLVEDHLAEHRDHGPGILTLITIDEFLRQGGLP